MSVAYLRAANLSGADLSGANLSGAYLRGANLRRANLYGANLIGVSLSHPSTIDAGQDVRGYRFVAVRHDDGPRITAGCRWLTLA